MTPDGPGPFPLAVINHGASGKRPPNLEQRHRLTFATFYFLSRGYAVALPMMRGFAKSQGIQLLDRCNQAEVRVRNAKDILAVINFMSARPYINGQQVVVAGQSFGGWNSLAVGSLSHPSVKGLLNFSGGANLSGCQDNLTALSEGAYVLGKQTRTPSLWFYGQNDTMTSTSLWQSMFRSYTSAGGPAQIVDYGYFMHDAHELLAYPEGLKLWTPHADAFLEKLGLPHKLSYSNYLPIDAPPPTNYASISDVCAVPYLSDQGRQVYQQFLQAPVPRAVVISPSGLIFASFSGFDPLQRAIRSCQDEASECQVYAADNAVTWIPSDSNTSNDACRAEISQSR